MKNANGSIMENDSVTNTNKYMDNQSEVFSEKNKNFLNSKKNDNGYTTKKSNSNINIIPNVNKITNNINNQNLSNININLNFKNEENSENKFLNKKINRKNTNKEEKDIIKEKEKDRFAVPMKKSSQQKSQINISLNIPEEEKPKKIKKNNPLAIDNNNIILNLSEDNPFNFSERIQIGKANENEGDESNTNENNEEENLPQELLQMKNEYRSLKNEYEKLKDYIENNKNDNSVELKEKEKLKKKIKKRLKAIKEEFKAS